MDFPFKKNLNPSLSKKERGDAAESKALAYLQQQGLTLILRNYRTPLGEIDLIMKEGEELIFVEVRYRASGNYASPLESITFQKQQRILKTAACYLQRYALSQPPPCRFDVVCITNNHIQWFQEAF
jgi:putative endonuclease